MKTIFFSVGEPSGDLHGANLIGKLQEYNPNIRCVGYGGPRMQEAGCRLHADLTQLAVMWFLRVVANIHKFLGLLFHADQYFKTQRPDAVVLIDYPGFNWWIARRAKARGIPVIYYGTPQLWAWAPWRIAKMQKFVDHVLCKLPFEEAWYRQRGCNATFVGHPYFDELVDRRLDHNFIDRQINSVGQLVSILPGSRDQEVTYNLPSMLVAAGKIKQKLPATRFAIASFSTRQAITAREMIQAAKLDADVHVHRTPELIEAADVCLACSGSVSLELLYHAKPSIIQYRVGRFAYWLQDRLRISRYITLANLLETDRIERMPGEQYHPDDPQADSIPMPEYVCCDDQTDSISHQVIGLLQNESTRQAKIDQLTQLRTRFASPGASQRAAEYIVRVLAICPAKSPARRIA